MAGMDAAYLKSLEQFLEAEAEMARQGVDLLNDPEYRTLRELYIDGEIDQEEFLGRIEALAESRPDEDLMPYTALDEADEALAEADGWAVDEEDEDGAGERDDDPSEGRLS